MKHAIKKRALHRLKILEGQVRGLQRMVEKDVYCIDILTQTSAAKEALSGVEDLLLKNHLTTHVVEQAKAGQYARSAQEILEIYRLAKRK